MRQGSLGPQCRVKCASDAILSRFESVLQALARAASQKTNAKKNVSKARRLSQWPSECIFFLTIFPNNFIYESHCDLYGSQILDVRETQSMKNATKKAAKKAPAKKAAAKKGKK